MDEQIANTKHRRKPIVAAILSLIVPGVGQIYCGRIIRGLVFIFFYVIFVPVTTTIVLENLSQINMVIIGIASLASLVIWLAAIIDSCRIAKRNNPDYELKEYNRWYVYVIFLLIAMTANGRINQNIKSDLIEKFKTPTLSMFPTIEYHDCFLANKKAYKKDEPKRGDIIIFVSPENRNEMWVKRVVAVAGDTVEIKGNQLFINGEKLEREDLGRTTYIDIDPNKKEVKVEGELLTEKNDQAEYTIFLEDTYDSKSFPNRYTNFPETKIPKNHCFVLGDNRNLSGDSRHFGPVPLATVKGRAEYIYWPPRNWSRFE
ncbi:MAG: signal peptidase I [Sedimentisphaerales bacterium]